MMNEIRVDILTSDPSVYDISVISNLNSNVLYNSEEPIIVEMSFAEISPVHTFNVDSSIKDISIENSMGIIVEHIDADPYDGPYTVDPLAASEVILGTKRKYCRKDITVNKIPRHSTSNEYGTTFYIAED